jgi:thiol-disulfide isomerase/thioredoxin
LKNDGTPLPKDTWTHLKSGKVFNTSDLRGRPTLLYFFAPWCGICNATASGIGKDFSEGNTRLIMIALSYDQVEEIEEFSSRHQVDNFVMLGNSQTAEKFKIDAFPTYYLLDESGAIKQKGIGLAKTLMLELLN